MRLIVRKTVYLQKTCDAYVYASILSITEMVKVSPDTAARDIKDLVEKGILVPQQGRVRDVFYGIRCSDSILVIPMPEEL